MIKRAKPANKKTDKNRNLIKSRIIFLPSFCVKPKNSFKLLFKDTRNAEQAKSNTKTLIIPINQPPLPISITFK